jgi:hypothetical protein
VVLQFLVVVVIPFLVEEESLIQVDLVFPFLVEEVESYFL